MIKKIDKNDFEPEIHSRIPVRGYMEGIAKSEEPIDQRSEVKNLLLSLFYLIAFMLSISALITYT